MHDRIARNKIIRGYIVGFVAGVICALIYTAEAHYNCDPECGYVTEINLETGEVTQTYVCEN